MFIAALTQDLYPRVTRQYPYPPLTRPVVRGYGTRTGTGTGGPQSTRTRPVLCPTRDLPPEENADILLLGCGDPRHVLYTLYSEPDNCKYS